MATKNNELAVVVEQVGNWTDEQVALIKSMCAKDATDDEFKVLLHMARKYDLDPLAKQIYLQKFWNFKDNKWNPASIIVTYAGFQEVANRSGNLDGLECVAVRVDGEIVGARSTLWKKNCAHPFITEVEMGEYFQTDRSGKPIGLWATKPVTMIKKVANAQNLRQAFSLSGLYTEEEMPAQIEEPAPSRQSEPVRKIEYTEAQATPLEPEPEMEPTIADRLGRAMSIEGLTGIRTTYDSKGTWREITEAECATALGVMVPGATTIPQAAAMLKLDRFGPIVAANFPDAQPPRTRGGPSQQYAALLHYVFDYQLRQLEVEAEKAAVKKRMQDTADLFGSEVKLDEAAV